MWDKSLFSHEDTKSQRNYKLKKPGVFVPLWQKGMNGYD